MAVLHILLNGETGGIQVLCHEYAKYSENNNIFYVGFCGGPVINDMINKGNNVVLRNFSKYTFVLMLIDLLNICRKKHVRTVVIQDISPFSCFAGIFVASILNIKLITYVHSVQTKKNKGFKYRLQNKILKIAMTKSAHVIAISQAVKKSIACDVENQNKIVVIYNGIDITKFIYDETKRYEQYGVIYVGRLVKEKGVDNLIRALDLIKQENNICCYIVGDGPEKDNLLELTNTFGLNNRVVFCGEQLDFSRWQNKSHLFVHPSLGEEGFGITLIEAMAAGIPCIGYNKGAIPELIIHGHNGWLVKEYTFEALANQIMTAYNMYSFETDVYKSIEKNAKKTAEKFQIQKMTSAFDKIVNCL